MIETRRRREGALREILSDMIVARLGDQSRPAQDHYSSAGFDERRDAVGALVIGLQDRVDDMVDELVEEFEERDAPFCGACGGSGGGALPNRCPRCGGSGFRA